MTRFIIVQGNPQKPWTVTALVSIPRTSSWRPYFVASMLATGLSRSSYHTTFLSKSCTSIFVLRWKIQWDSKCDCAFRECNQCLRWVMQNSKKVRWTKEEKKATGNTERLPLQKRQGFEPSTSRIMAIGKESLSTGGEAWYYKKFSTRLLKFINYRNIEFLEISTF